MNEPSNSGQNGVRLGRSGLTTFLLATTVVAAGLVGAPRAFAGVVSIGVATSLTGTVQTLPGASGTGHATVSNLALNSTTISPALPSSIQGWTIESASGTGTPPLQQGELLTDTIDVSTTGSAASTLYLFVTETGLTAPIGGISTDFANNGLTGSVTSVTERSYADLTNATYGLGTELASFSSTAGPPGAIKYVTTLDPLSGTYSLTLVYELVSSGLGYGQGNLTINLFPVAEPSSIAILGVGLIGMISVLGRRHRAVF